MLAAFRLAEGGDDETARMRVETSAQFRHSIAEQMAVPFRNADIRVICKKAVNPEREERREFLSRRAELGRVR